MSFRNRLTLFFVLIVVVPMVAVAFVLFRLIADNESGKADARLAATKGSAINLYREDYNRANQRRGGSAATWRWRRRCATNDRQALQARLDVLLKQENVRRIVVARAEPRHRPGRQHDCGLPGVARPRGPEQARRSARSRCPCRSRRPTRACSRG